MPIVTVDGIGFGDGTRWNNESVILLFLDGAALTVKLLQDLVGLFTTHNKIRYYNLCGSASLEKW